ncbi:hypothetical protein BpHYR1_039116 [Brachionus plicatilis]|uniref:Uncharacterized protein n=1 Tax=Brachionus plicatilis TaxID=10195 RepID=A0A3M7T2E0_BRAPC|nr:hypothetical protein BpHYR1_039116 [Brachionus plicatilis]
MCAFSSRQMDMMAMSLVRMKKIVLKACNLMSLKVRAFQFFRLTNLFHLDYLELMLKFLKL